MAKILYADDEADLVLLLTLTIEGAFEGVNVIGVSSGQEAISYLKNNSDIDIILSDYKMPNGNGEELYDYVRTNNQDIPFMLITGCIGEQDESNAFVERLSADKNSKIHYKPYKLNEILTDIKDYFLEDIKNVNANMRKIPLPGLSMFNAVPCDLYVELSEKKHVKILNSGELYDSSFVKKYLDKGVNYFYTPAANFEQFVEEYVGSVKIKLLQDKMDYKERIEVQGDAVSFVHSYVSQIGLRPEVVSTMDGIVESSAVLLKSDEKLFSLLSGMLKKKDYIAGHSLMISYVAGAMSLKMDWYTQTTLQKLGLSALMHDIALQDEKLARFLNLKDAQNAGISKDDLEKIKKHPVVAAEMFRKQKDVCPDVDHIVLCHHERPNRSGFPRALGSGQISPMVGIFTVAEEFVCRVYDLDASQEKCLEIAREMLKEAEFSICLKSIEGLIKVFEK